MRGVSRTQLDGIRILHCESLIQFILEPQASPSVMKGVCAANINKPKKAEYIDSEKHAEKKIDMEYDRGIFGALA
jgi:hypothetical protein